MLNVALVAQIQAALEMVKPPIEARNNALTALAALVEAEKCNGWSNWETWNVKLWLDNDQGTYESVREVVRSNVRETEGVASYDGTLAEAIKEFCDELTQGDETPASMATDLLRGALGAVNWQEIARAYVDEMVEA